jgi:hypothetical protein
MVIPGDNLTMLGQWRITLKQAEESARAGRFEEALGLLSRPNVADHRQGVQLRARVAKLLVERAQRRSQADDLAGAIDDLVLAEQNGAAPDVLAATRLRIAERVSGEVAQGLVAGDPARCLERIDSLARHQIHGPELRRYRQVAEAWSRALEESRRGEFGRAREALDQAERLGGSGVADSLAAARKALEARQAVAVPRIERLYKALADAKDWGEILAAAEGLLEVVSEHPAARQARAQAWQRIGALSPSATLPARPDRPGPAVAPGVGLAEARCSAEKTACAHDRQPAAGVVFLDDPATSEPAARVDAGPRGRMLLWADAVGGFLVCLDPEVVIGRAGSDSQADIPLLGDLSRRHASLIRHGDGYIVRAFHPTYINGRQVVGTGPLRDRDVLRLGSSVELLFRQPSPISATARLEIVSHHRLPMAVEGVILMAETCIIGPPPQSHVIAEELREPLVLFRQAGQIWCRAPGSFEVDGRPCAGRVALGARSRVCGHEFSFGIEPVGAKPGKV